MSLRKAIEFCSNLVCVGWWTRQMGNVKMLLLLFF